MSLQDITITSSIKSIATQSYDQKTYIASTEEQSFPIETITGSYAGVWPNFKPRSLTSTNSASNTTVDLIVNVTQSWTGSNISPLGIVPYTHYTMEEFIDGEFSGSVCLVSNGNLTDPYCEQFLIPPDISFNYKIFYYGYDINNGTTYYLDAFLDPYTSPRSGEMLVYYEYKTTVKKVKYIKISKTDADGNNLSNTLASLTQIIWKDTGISNVARLLINPLSISEIGNYYLFEILQTNSVFPIGNFNEKNILNYKFVATGGLDYTGTPGLGVGEFLVSPSGSTYANLANDWIITIDSASGWDGFSTYTFPLTPNIPIRMSASLSMSFDYPVTFSWAIRAIDPTNNSPSLNIYDDLYNPSNFQYLNSSSNYILTIDTSSYFHPVQNYQYQISAYIKPNEIHPVDTNLIGTGSTGDTPNPNGLQFGNVPFPWKTWKRKTISPLTFETASLTNGAFISINKFVTGSNQYLASNAPIGSLQTGSGVFVNDVGAASTLLTWWSSSYTDDIWGPGDIGKTYRIDINVPYYGNINGSNLGIINPDSILDQYNISSILGPSLKNITIVTTTQGTDNLITTQSYIGIIPSNSFGNFSFIYTVQSGDRKLGILAPIGSSYSVSPPGWLGAYYYNYFVIDNIDITQLSPATGSTPPGKAIHWIITQSNASQSASSSIVFEPYIPTNFYNTDCDVLINNAFQNDISTTYQEVLYDNGGTIPSNLQQIINGTAEYAQINDYLYTANANRLPRYDGVRSESPDFNLPTTINGYGALPNVELNQTYFAYFDYLQSTNPNLLGKSAAHIRYLIDKDGNVQLPSISSSYYWNLIDNYFNYQYAEVILQEDNETKENLGYKQILRAGEYPKVVLSTLTDLNTANTFILLRNSEFIIPTYRNAWITNSPSPNYIQIAVGGSVTIPFTINTPYQPYYIQVDNSIILNPDDWTFKINLDSNITTITCTLTLDQYTSISPCNVNIVLEKSVDTYNWEVVSQQIVNIGTISTYVNFDLSPEKDVYYKWRIYNNNSSDIKINNITLNTTSTPLSTEAYIGLTGSINPLYAPNNFEIQPGIGISLPEQWNRSFGPFFITGSSSSKNILTSSVFYRYYDEDKPFTQVPYVGSLYKDFAPFRLKYGDYISFINDVKPYMIQEITRDEIIDEGIIDTNFSTWTLSGNVTIDASKNILHLNGGSGASDYATKQFYSTYPQNTYFELEFEISNYTPINSSSRFIIRLLPSLQQIEFYPTRNGKYYCRLKNTTAGTTTQTLLIGYAGYFYGDISNLKVKVYDPMSPMNMYLKLDRDLKNSLKLSDIQQFVINSFQPDPNYVILDTTPSNFKGYLFPKNVTSEIKQNFDNIIVKLQKDGLLT